MGDSSDQAITMLLEASGISVIVGAGISIAAGIPAFRGPNGQHGEKFDGYHIRELFDYQTAITGPARQAHYKYMAAMAKSAIRAIPTEFHKFLQVLDACGQLKRLYSQNIDGLEAKVGFDTFATNPGRKCVLLHGNLATLRCEKCATLYMMEHYLALLENGESIACPGCIQKASEDSIAQRRPKKPGHLRPNILLYNESCPAAEDIGDIAVDDARALKTNHVLLICGTSLQIPGIKKIMKTFKSAIFDVGLTGCRIIYVDTTSNPSATLPAGYLHIKLDCQEFAKSAMAEFHNRMPLDRQPTNRTDFRPFWDWN